MPKQVETEVEQEAIQTIWKYNLERGQVQHLVVPAMAQPMYVTKQRCKPVIYFHIPDTTLMKQMYTVVSLAAGVPFPEGFEINEYIQLGPLGFNDDKTMVHYFARQGQHLEASVDA